MQMETVPIPSTLDTIGKTFSNIVRYCEVCDQAVDAPEFMRELVAL